MCRDEVIRLKKIACHTHGSGYLFEKKLPAVHTDQVIHSKIVIIRAIGWGYPCKNNLPAVHFKGLFK